MATADDLPLANHNGTNRDLVLLQGLAGFLQCLVHKKLVGRDGGLFIPKSYIPHKGLLSNTLLMCFSVPVISNTAVVMADTPNNAASSPIRVSSFMSIN